MLADPNVFDFQEVIETNNLRERLSDDQIGQLENLLVKYYRIFSNIPGKTSLVEHDIELICDKPIKHKPYRMTNRQNDLLKAEIDKMLKYNIIEPGASEFTSPMILAETPGREPRPCIDYRKLNEITRTQFYPISNIEQRLETVAKASKMMNEILEGCDEYAIPYLDDIAIFSQTWDKHLKHLQDVLERIKRAKLTIKPPKCKFAQDEVQYLGHIVGHGKRSPAELKVKAVQNFPIPTTKTEIRAFLG
ncbi:Transposon Ty3-I Gag-Pol polyprotein [Araneus ventricosus]|uniref:Transposon Ty3-I Gag-Pol polyprotein n=1 Tax=Araneus ventricosus TaxID=182803 RepID=A0A4Y2D8G3_ARAVE|nr:Transposon Ty3-I Gag-Pol polyprotein [Araneus ventricosus]